MKRKLVTFLIVVLLSLPAGALAEEQLFIATTEWPPHVIWEKGEPTGLFVEVVIEICKRLDIKPKIEILPWARATKYVKDGTADVLMAPRKTEERLQFLDFPEEPFYPEKLVIMTLKGSGITASKLDAIKGNVVGVVRGYSYGAEFDNYQNIKRIDCNDDSQMLRLLDKGRINLIVGDEVNLKYLAKQEKIKGELETIYILSNEVDYIAFSKKALGERSKILAEKFSQILRQLRTEGFIQKIESKYF